MCSSTLNRNLGGVTRDNMQAHHLIPEEIWNKHQLFFDKIGMGGERDKKEGGLLMPDSADKAKQMKRKFYHCGPHAVYFAAVGAKVTDIKTDFNAGRIDKSTARQKISQLQSASRLALMAPGSNPIRIFLEKSWNITH
ncbi:MAG: AHH domain-containing protein [Burkholderia sp.]|nr:AHH domain-containing protein [Burkholderia sp.]MDR0240581.1 AHH domain-containing protein [Burkholderia sp.]